MKSAPFPLVAILGPTGSGKSALALTLGELLGGEIVNYDSVQAVRGLDIGSAKLPPGERRGLPHHLIDIVDPAGDLNAGSYARLARPVLSEIGRRGALPVLVGGTGLYLRALLDGLSPAPTRDGPLRTRLSALASRRPATLHRFIRRYDPQAACRIHPNDRQKLIRAVELTLLARRPLSETQSYPRNPLEGFSILKIGLDPDRRKLYEHLNARTERLFREGLITETSTLLKNGAPPEAKALQSLGYRQAVKILRGDMLLPAAVEECQARTRQYAKRQLTWFRREPQVHWLAGFGADPAIQAQALTLVDLLLASGAGYHKSCL